MYRFISNTQHQRGSWLLNAILVVVVMGVVGAVLFPVLTPAYGNRRSTCSSNIHEVAIALQIYSNDFDGMLPSSNLVSGSKKWNRADFLRFATKIGIPPPAQGGKRDTYAEIIYDYVKNKDILFCPSDPVDKNKPNAHASYWWKTAADKAWYGEGCKHPCQKVGDFGYPADQVIFYEHRNFHADETCGLTNGTQINVAFLDSHVKNVIITNATSGDTVNCAANEDGQPMYSNYDLKAKKGLADGKTPARFIDPARYGDKFGTHARPTRPTTYNPWPDESEPWLGVLRVATWIAGLLVLVGLVRMARKRAGQPQG